MNYGRHIIIKWSELYFKKSLKNIQNLNEIHVLDIGCGHGEDLKNIRNASEKVSDLEGRNFKIFLHGIENYRPYLEECMAGDIDVHSVDIEHGSYPFAEGSMDIIVANQVLEHTKEIFWIFSEVSRLLKPGGYFIIGVPNLASLHNRILLFFGLQPTAQKSLSAHVRTFTKGDLKEFGENGGYFSFKFSAGSNFYPFPPLLSKPLSRIFPSLAWGLFVCLEKTDRGIDFLDCLYDGEVLETPFYGGPQNPQVLNLKSRPRILKKQNAKSRTDSKSKTKTSEKITSKSPVKLKRKSKSDKK